MEFLKDILIKKIGIDIDLIPNLLDLVEERKILKNQFLIQEGQKCDFIAFVEEGVFRSFICKTDIEYNNDFYLPQTIATALTSFLTKEKTSCNIQALTPAKVYYLHRSKLDKLISENQEWIKLSKYVSDTYFIRKCKRERSFLEDNAENRLKMVCDLFPNIEQLVTQYHIASYLGIKPQSLSRLKSSRM